MSADANPHTFYLPDLGEGLLDAVVVEWVVEDGQHVEEGDPILEVETTKSAVEIPAGFTGTFVRRRAEAQARVAVGEPLFEYSDDAAPGVTGSAEGGIVGVVPSSGKPARGVRLRPPDVD